MKPKIGFIGVGIMGSYMSTHLLDAGYDVIAYDIFEPALEKVVTRGAGRGSSCQDVAARSDVVITMLPDSPDVAAVALGSSGIIEAAREGLIHVDMSTIAPDTAIQAAETLGAKGVRCLDAPVSGGEIGAKNAMLSIMVGGPEDLFHTVLPILDVMGKTIVWCGPNGAGQTVKACNQIQVALNFVGMAEALVLGVKAGVDPAVIVKVLSGGYAQTRVMDVRGPKIIKGEFEPGFRSKFHYKDLNDHPAFSGSSPSAEAVARHFFQEVREGMEGDGERLCRVRVWEAPGCSATYSE